MDLAKTYFRVPKMDQKSSDELIRTKWTKIGFYIDLIRKIGLKSVLLRLKTDPKMNLNWTKIHLK